MDTAPPAPRLPRRKIIQWFTAAAATSKTFPLSSFAQSTAPSATTQGYGTDPVLAAVYSPGDFWPLTFSAAERKAVTALADFVLPSDEFGPSASSLRVPDYIDEWISAPYPKQLKDRETIVPGLKWIDEESRSRFQNVFAELAEEQQKILCDDLSLTEHKDKKLKNAAAFFRGFIALCMSAYYATPEGWKAIGYVGNIPSGSFGGPPQEVLDRLGLEQTVKD